MTASRDRERGFTLLELLVSMTLLAMLFVLLFGGLRFGMRAWERGTSTADAVDQVRAVQELLRGEIERACPHVIPNTDPQAPPRVQFAGDSNAVSFLGPAPNAAGSARCVRLSLSLAPDGKHQRLVLNINGNDSDLLRGVQSADLAYLADGGVWQSGWSGQRVLPALIRVRVSFPKGDARVWPELFLTPRISAEADCTYDPALKSCRGS